jgi:hypothetical protein
MGRGLCLVPDDNFSIAGSVIAVYVNVKRNS